MGVARSVVDFICCRSFINQCVLWAPPKTTSVVGGGQRRRISWTVVCGVMLFVLGFLFLPLFTSNCIFL
ncbi:hypothetical protein HanIR_Chr12g0589531 [Helianthus annuus]|nr:hypothetical protein HanIR_Chr12g0589531 [Helianthus annuus]